MDNPCFNRATCSTRLVVSAWDNRSPQASDTRKPCRDISNSKQRKAYGYRSSVMARWGTRLTLIFFCRTWARS
jgi:hypothetical protein